MKPIRTERLILRNWEERDRELFYRINTDERIMRFFPFRRNRDECDLLMDRLRDGIATRGYGFGAAEIAETGKCIGFVGLFPCDASLPLPENSVEIGWRLVPEHWGKGYASEAGRAWLAYGFEQLGLDEICSFAVEGNAPSIAVMLRLGMTHVGRFDHPYVPDSHPHLKSHVLYRLRKD